MTTNKEKQKLEHNVCPTNNTLEMVAKVAAEDDIRN